MRVTGLGNERMPCSSIPGPDLFLWQEVGTGHLQLGLLPTRVRALSTRLRAQITSGHIKSDTGSVLWDGQTPVPLPTGSSFRCLWSGTLTISSIHGIFSLQLGSQQWLNGWFSFQILTHWFQSGSWEVSGTFTSPVYFKQVGQFRVPASHPPPVELSENFSTISSVQTTSKPLTMPVALEGAYSSDRMVFWWSRSIILTIPNASQYQVQANGKFSEESETNNETFGDENSGSLRSERKEEMQPKSDHAVGQSAETPHTGHTISCNQLSTPELEI